MEDEFEECCDRGDECGKQRVVQKYLEYWENIENDPSFSQRELSSEKYDFLLNEYILLLCLYALYEDYEALAQAASRGKNPENLDLFLGSPCIINFDIDDLVINIEKQFRPLTDHTELIMSEVPPLCIGYIHPKEHILLVTLPGNLDITLLTPKKLAPDVLAEIEQSIGLTFHPMRP